jgi:hypothetical protein
LAWFADAFRRYLPNIPSASVAPSHTNKFKDLDENSSVAAAVPATDKNSPKSLKNNDCDGATDTNLLSRHSGHTEQRCRQCNGTPDDTEREYTIDGEQVFLHEQCAPFWRVGNEGHR